MKNKKSTLTVFILSVFIILGLTAGCISTYGLTDGSECVSAASSDSVQNLINEFQHETKCTSVSVVIYDQGKVSYYGDSDGLYQIGSMTKAFTGLAVQKLMDDGLLSEDDKVSKFLVDFETYYNSEKVDITIKDLLTQTSGFTNSEKDYPSAETGMTLAEWTDTMSGKELKSKPGTEYAYSNVNYNLLGAIIEKVSGTSYKDYMEKKILSDIGLHNTYIGEPYHKTNSDDNEKTIEGSRLFFRRTVRYNIPVREATIPAGYFYSNTKDMGKWLEYWIKRNQVFDTQYYAGWERFDDGIIGHSGGTPNYSSRIVYSREKLLGVCVLTNLNVAASTDCLCNSIYGVLSGNDKNTIAVDVWTVFDIVFTIVSVVMLVIGILIILLRKRKALIIIGITLIVLLVAILITFPLIFGAGMKDIVLIWAPWSMAGGLGIMIVDIVFIILKTGIRKHEYSNEASEG